MSAIKTLPTEKTFGLGFNYALWEANTDITLCNVRWNSDYRDVVRFNSQDDLDSYLRDNSGPTINIQQASMAKFGKPIRLPIPLEVAQQFNYIKVANPAQPIGAGSFARNYYYFIVEVEYSSPGNTNVYVQLDVWQSFSRDVIFGNCYIERSHLAIAASNSFEDHGREYLTIPEGFDLGNEYQIVDQWQHSIGSARGDNNYSICIMSTVDLTADPGTVEEPKLNTAKGTNFENLPGGAEIYFFRDADNFKTFMEEFSDKPWVTQGIISITATPDIARYSLTADMQIVNIGSAEAWVLNGTLAGRTFNMKTFFRNVIFDKIGFRYTYLKKFATYPYSQLELTSYSGTPLVIKPENWKSDHAEVVEDAHLIQPGARIVFYPRGYNKSSTAPPSQTDQYGMYNDGGEFLDMATGILNLPTFSLVNNGYISFLASNKNSLAYQHSSADWSQAKAQQGIATSYDQANANIGTSQDVTRQGMNAAQQQANIANQGSMAQGIIGGINSLGSLGNGPGGAISAASGIVNTGLQTALDINQRNQNLGVTQGLAAGTNKSQTDNMAFMRDTNNELATFSAKGDYQNAILGINAKVQDAALTQPTTSGQIGGDSYNLARYKWGVDLKLKMLAPAALRTIGEFWLRYGYAMNVYRRLPGNLSVMTHFTYWKLKETYIISSKCPEPMKQTIRGIFEKGVTVWRNPNDIGTIDIGDNVPDFTGEI